MTQVDPKMGQNGPKWPENGPKMARKWPENGPNMLLCVQYSFDGFYFVYHFGAILGHSEAILSFWPILGHFGPF